MSRKPILALVLMLSLCAPPAALAFTAPMKSDQPIHVVSDRLEVDNKSQVANFIGAVKAVQGDVTINSDSLEVYYDRDAAEQASPAAAKPAAPAAGQPATEGAPSSEGGLMDGGGKVRKVVAIGHVKIVQQDRVGLGQKATYWAGGRKILLEGQATVWRGKNQVSGEQITVFLDEDRSIVHGTPGKRVAVTIVPEGSQGGK
ncbi:MAG: LptA/OstA family protein [Pseudomonadota bacterium]